MSYEESVHGKLIPGFAGKYSVTERGEVWDLRRGTPKLNHLGVTKHGYITSHLWDELGQLKSRRVHRLVAMTYIGPIPDGYMVCHNDGTRDNNHVSNLRIGTNSCNTLDQVKHGTFFYRNGELSALSKFNADKILEVINLLAQSEMTFSAIAEATKVSRETVRDVGLVKTWKHIPRPDNFCEMVSKRKKNIVSHDVAKEIYNLSMLNELSQREIASMFGVSRPLVAKIKSGNHWFTKGVDYSG